MGRTHECTEVDNRGSKYMLICPICDCKIKVEMDDADSAFRIHEASGKCQPKEKKKVPKCLACKKKITDTNSVECKKCLQRVCFSHRAPEDHDCLGRPPSKLLGLEKRN